MSVNETMKRLHKLRSLSNAKLDALAVHHGFKLHQHKPGSLVIPGCPWVVLDQIDKPRLWWGFFPTKRDAIIMCCMEHKIDAADYTKKEF